MRKENKQLTMAEAALHYGFLDVNLTAKTYLDRIPARIFADGSAIIGLDWWEESQSPDLSGCSAITAKYAHYLDEKAWCKAMSQILPFNVFGYEKGRICIWQMINSVGGCVGARL